MLKKVMEKLLKSEKENKTKKNHKRKSFPLKQKKKKKFIDEDLLKNLESKGYKRPAPKPEVPPLPVIKVKKIKPKPETTKIEEIIKVEPKKTEEIIEEKTKKELLKEIKIPEAPEEKSKPAFFKKLGNIFSSKPAEVKKTESDKFEEKVEETKIEPEEESVQGIQKKLNEIKSISQTESAESEERFPVQKEEAKSHAPKMIIYNKEPKESFFTKIKKIFSKKEKNPKNELESITVSGGKNEFKFMSDKSNSYISSPYSKPDENISLQIKDQIIPQKTEQKTNENIPSSSASSSIAILFSDKKKKLQ